MPTAFEQMHLVLKTLVANTPDLEGAATVSLDGLVLASVLPAGTDEDRVSAMAAALLSLGERTSDGAGSRQPGAGLRQGLERLHHPDGRRAGGGARGDRRSGGQAGHGPPRHEAGRPGDLQAAVAMLEARARLLQDRLLSLVTRVLEIRGLMLVDRDGLPLVSTLGSRSLEE